MKNFNDFIKWKIEKKKLKNEQTCREKIENLKEKFEEKFEEKIEEEKNSKIE